MRFAAVAALCTSLLALTACAGGDSSATSAPKLLNEQRGTYQGVGLGSSSADVRARFGNPSDSQGFAPLEPEGVKGPYAFGVPGGVRPTVMRYDRVAFILQFDEVFGLITSDESAVLTRKVGIGDSLGDMRRAYPFACREARAGEGILGPTYTVCHAELANGSQIVVTDDPVESITLLHTLGITIPPHLIDEGRGTVGGVGIGDTVAKLQRRFGVRKPAVPSEPVTPLGNGSDDFTGPVSFRLGGPPTYRYRGISFFAEGGRIVGFMATGEGYWTTRGARIGDSLADAARAYTLSSSFHCGTARLAGRRFPACAGEIGLAPARGQSSLYWHRYLWLGGDPVSTITVGVRPLRGV